MTKYLHSRLVSSGRRPARVITHSVCLPSTVSPICLQSHNSASQLTPINLTLNALPSPQFARNPQVTGLNPALEKSGSRLLSPSTRMNTGDASARHRHPRAKVARDTANATRAMTALATGAISFNAATNAPIFPFLCCVGLLFVALSLALQGKGPIVSLCKEAV